MLFQSPLYLVLLVLIPALVLWYVKSGRKNQGTLQISSEKYTSIKIRRTGSIKKNVILGLHLSIIFLIIIGLSRPQKIDKITENSVNVDMIVQNISDKGLTDMTFSCPISQVARAENALKGGDKDKNLRYGEILVDKDISKLSIVVLIVGLSVRSVYDPLNGVGVLDKSV